MKKITITPRYPIQSYDVLVLTDVIEDALAHISLDTYSRLLVCTDTQVGKLYSTRIADALRRQVARDRISFFTFDAGESHKTLDTVISLYRALSDHRMDKHSLVLNVGGGVASDLGGFAAATYMRGISFITVPTTLESMVDACIGGKTGVNFHGYKNYIGTITQPKQVVISTEFLQTLPVRALVQGYAEVIKHGLIADKEYFLYTSKQNPIALQDRELVDLIRRSLEIKADIIQKDPEEKKDRKLLNFGHTVGHAVESLSLKTDAPLYHGEAVAIGIVAEAYLSQRAGYLPEKEFSMIESAIAAVGLPVRCDRRYEVNDMFTLLTSDKKNECGVIKWTLLKTIGEGVVDQEMEEKFIRESLHYILT